MSHTSRESPESTPSRLQRFSAVGTEGRLVAKNRWPKAIALLIIPLACLCLGACGSSSGGGSSSKTSTSAAAPATTQTTPTSSTSKTPTSTTPADASTEQEPEIKTAHQFQLLYECLRRNGVKLPTYQEARKKNFEDLKLNTQTAQYKAIRAKCAHAVLG